MVGLMLIISKSLFCRGSTAGFALVPKSGRGYCSFEVVKMDGLLG